MPVYILLIPPKSIEEYNLPGSGGEAHTRLLGAAAATTHPPLLRVLLTRTMARAIVSRSSRGFVNVFTYYSLADAVHRCHTA